MGGYLLANVIIGIPVAIAVIVMCRKKDKDQRSNDCELCKNLKKINVKPYSYAGKKYECKLHGNFYDQPQYCCDWKARNNQDC